MFRFKPLDKAHFTDRIRPLTAGRDKGLAAGIRSEPVFGVAGLELVGPVGVRGGRPPRGGRARYAWRPRRRDHGCYGLSPVFTELLDGLFTELFDAVFTELFVDDLAAAALPRDPPLLTCFDLEEAFAQRRSACWASATSRSWAWRESVARPP